MENFKIEYIYEIIDKFSPVAEKINAQTKAIQAAAASATVEAKEYYKKHVEGMDRFSGKLKTVGKNMSLWLTTPIIGMGALAVREYSQAENAIQQITGALETNGNKAKLNIKELDSWSKAITGTISSTDILQNVTMPLIRSRKISHDIFNRIQQDVIDIHSRTGKSVENISQAMVIAMDTGQTSMFKKLGVTISNHDSKVLRSMIQSKDQNKVMLAQTKLLEMLEKNYKGAGKIAAETGTGPLKILKNNINDLAQAYGATIASFTKDSTFMKQLNRLVQFLTDLDPKYKMLIISTLAFVAALGPLTLALSAVIKSIVIWKTSIQGIIIAKKTLMAIGFIQNIKTEISWMLVHIKTFGLLKGAIWSVNGAIAANPMMATIILLTSMILALTAASKGLGKVLSKMPEWLEKIYNWASMLMVKLSPLTAIMLKIITATSSEQRGIDNLKTGFEKDYSPELKAGRKISPLDKKIQESVLGLGKIQTVNKNYSEVLLTIDMPKEIQDKVSVKTIKKTGTGLNLGYNMAGH